MKLCIVNTLYTPNLIGGAERSVQTLAEAMAQAGHEVTVVTTAPNTSIRNVNGVEVYYLKLRNFYWPFNHHKVNWLKPMWHILDTYNPLMGSLLGGILDIQQPDLVHTHSLAGFSITAWEQVKLRRIPLVHTLRDFHLACARSNMYRNGRYCHRPC